MTGRNSFSIKFVILMLCIALTCAVAPLAAELASPDVADDGSFAMTISLSGSETVKFKAKDFTIPFSELGLDLRGIVITDLPDPSFGSLTLDKKPVELYDTIPKAKLGRLSFSGTGMSESKDSFTFKGYDKERFLDLPATVTFSMDQSGSLIPETQNIAVATFKNVSLGSRFKLNDYAYDNCSLVVSKAPRLGDVVVNPVNNTFTYTPHLGKTGRDTFTYYAQDSEGNVSSPSTVTIDINNSKNVTYYEDMQGHWAHNAAITLSQTGVITGEKIGVGNFFRPDETVSRADFMMMLMSVTGLDRDMKACTDTGLADDAKIAGFMKKYVKTALDNNVISGVGTDAGPVFNGNEPISRAQAAAMINNSLKLADVRNRMKDYTDRESVPTWAQQPIINLDSAYILQGYDDNSMRPLEPITRAQCAQLLTQVMDYLNSQKPKSSGVFGFVMDLFR